VRRKPPLRDLNGRPVPRKYCEAIHEAGHTIVALALRIHVQHVSLVDDERDGAGGSCVVTMPAWLSPYLLPSKLTHKRRPAAEQHGPQRRALLGRFLAQGRAGYVAERMLVGIAPHPFWHREEASDTDSDAAQSRVMARLLGVRGVSIRPFVESFDPRARAILEQRWHEVVSLAHELDERFRRRRVDGREVRHIIAGSK
jgi:hypothetical protein